MEDYEKMKIATELTKIVMDNTDESFNLADTTQTDVKLVINKVLSLYEHLYYDIVKYI